MIFDSRRNARATSRKWWLGLLGTVFAVLAGLVMIESIQSVGTPASDIPKLAVAPAARSGSRDRSRKTEADPLDAAADLRVSVGRPLPSESFPRRDASAQVEGIVVGRNRPGPIPDYSFDLVQGSRRERIRSDRQGRFLSSMKFAEGMAALELRDGPGVHARPVKIRRAISGLSNSGDDGLLGLRLAVMVGPTVSLTLMPTAKGLAAKLVPRDWNGDPRDLRGWVPLRDEEQGAEWVRFARNRQLDGLEVDLIVANEALTLVGRSELPESISTAPASIEVQLSRQSSFSVRADRTCQAVLTGAGGFQRTCVVSTRPRVITVPEGVYDLELSAPGCQSIEDSVPTYQGAPGSERSYTFDCGVQRPDQVVLLRSRSGRFRGRTFVSLSVDDSLDPHSVERARWCREGPDWVARVGLEPPTLGDYSVQVWSQGSPELEPGVAPNWTPVVSNRRESARWSPSSCKARSPGHPMTFVHDDVSKGADLVFRLATLPKDRSVPYRLALRVGERAWRLLPQPLTFGGVALRDVPIDEPLEWVVAMEGSALSHGSSTGLEPDEHGRLSVELTPRAGWGVLVETSDPDLLGDEAPPRSTCTHEARRLGPSEGGWIFLVEGEAPASPSHRLDCLGQGLGEALPNGGGVTKVEQGESAGPR